MKTHRVSVTVWLGDIRPSRRVNGQHCGSCRYEWHVDTTEHGARTVFGRERNGALSRPYQMGTEELPHDESKPDRRVIYVVTQHEGLTYTDVIVSERWPRYPGMYGTE